MQCPFIRDTRALSCRAAGIRKLIPGLALASAGRCNSPAWADCPYSSAAPDPTAAACPFMEESLVQFCSAAPVTRFIPYSEPLLSRCGSDAYRYCDLYLDVVSASRPALNHSGALHAPHDLLFTPNHWWLDASGDGPCHLGIDAFLARLLGPIDHITFATPHGIARPTAIFTVRGTDFTSSFSELI
ncbi:MAG: hypothetical protein HY821_16975, partial [Acidobacteria bacterium]|nr:hypothetical protein [Acidobacteriota bacterium]